MWRGHGLCRVRRMPVARHFTELIVWQLGDQHRVEIFRLTKRPAFHADLKLRSQLDDASDSVCRNVAEGFGCKSDREFARLSASADGH